MPTFGKAAIPAIKEADVRRRRATRLERGLGLSTTAKVYRLMRAIMNTAADGRSDPPEPLSYQGWR
ncbi:hypothetical protein [Embleya scabrispora]|uniref:hypothetical protein n=1 Tax=Embleya scabrispora TaxID=159449 RepID=UPI00099B387A|nr:hypothetical protein [Embleya scabrispora]